MYGILVYIIRDSIVRCILVLWSLRRVVIKLAIVTGIPTYEVKRYAQEIML